MTRAVSLFDSRPPWLAAAAVLSLLAAAACGGGTRQSTASGDGVATPPASTPAVPASHVSVPPAAEPSPAPPATYEDGEALYKAGKFAEARGVFESVTGRTPDNVWGYYMLGMAAWKTGDRTGAERAFDRALEKDPHHLKSLLNSARVLIEAGRLHEALDRVNLAREVDSSSTETLRLLARVQDELGDASAAIAGYRQALIRDERDVWAMNNLGMLYIRQREFESALGPLARAVELRPNAPVFQNNLGIALELAGHAPEARRAYGDALKADSTYAKAIANARRLGDGVSDSTKGTPVSVKDLAETFRQQVKLWKESVSTPPER
jgi:predicted Zn-dependent protease